MKLFDKLLHESAGLLRSIAKRLDEDRDESIISDPTIPYWHRHLYAKQPESRPPLAPWEMSDQRAPRRQSPLLYRENRRAIEGIFAKRGLRAEDTIESVLKESRRS